MHERVFWATPCTFLDLWRDLFNKRNFSLHLVLFLKEEEEEEGEEEEEEEEDLFVFNDTIEGPRAPAVKPGRVTQA